MEKKLLLFTNLGWNEGLKLQPYIYLLSRRILRNPLTYSMYEKILWSQIKNGVKPEHIGVILDGNRRWASHRAKRPWEGHQFGADKVDDLLMWCIDLDIKSVTIYTFSMENFQRSPLEVEELMRLLEERLQGLLTDERIRANRVQVKIIGRTHLLPKRTQDVIHVVEETTAAYDHHYLTLAVAYGGRAEIIDAIKKISNQIQRGQLAVSDISEEVIEDNLYTAYLPNSEPDLIIRTSGEERLSGFLIWQSVYSELCFIDVFWPDFRRIDLWRAIRTFQQRKRRYGK
jgi:tritrans,polycis-undecaprenyl-diphosphate synthase [geranylgeranyl-diphosphate specific]